MRVCSPTGSGNPHRGAAPRLIVAAARDHASGRREELLDHRWIGVGLLDHHWIGDGLLDHRGWGTGSDGGGCGAGGERGEGAPDLGRVGGEPERRQARPQEPCVARGGQPRVEDRHDASVIDRADQAPGALGEPQRCVGSGHGHEPVSTGQIHRALARRHQRVARASCRGGLEDVQEGRS